jgi:DNA-binding MarR family transcriptional regulator
MAPGPIADPAPDGYPAGSVGDGSQLARFLRYGQIFSAAVHELVGARCLADVFRHKLTLPQLHLLKAISHDGQHRVSDVAAFLGVSSPAATKCVDKLERLGLVARAQSPTDRRATLVAASERAQTLVREYERVKRNRLEPILSGFEGNEVDQLIDLLERFAVEFYSRERPESDTCLWCGAYFDDDCAIASVRGGCPCQEFEASASTETDES